jgi:hypothetical protein
MIKLFYAPHPCSLSSHITLEEAGVAYSISASTPQCQR